MSGRLTVISFAWISGIVGCATPGMPDASTDDGSVQDTPHARDGVTEAAASRDDGSPSPDRAEPDDGPAAMDASEPVDAILSMDVAMVTDARIDAAPHADVPSSHDVVASPDVVADAATPVAFPDASNTGYRHAPGCTAGLTAWAGGPIESGHTYACIDFGPGLGVGSPTAHVHDVSFHGCRFHGVAVGNALVQLYGDNLVFDYCSFEPGVAAPPVAYARSYQYGIAGNGGYNTVVQQLTVTHCDFWGFGNAIDTQGSTQSKPHVFRDNWIHDAAADGGAMYHTDGIGAESGAGTGSYVVVDHNTIESAGNTNGLAYQAGHYDHFTITRNLFGGFGYTVALLGGATDTTFTDNTFSTRLSVDWGPLYGADFWTTRGSTWRRNRWMVPAGAAWGDRAHDGWYWLPNADGNSGVSDTPFVGMRDFGG